MAMHFEQKACLFRTSKSCLALGSVRRNYLSLVPQLYHILAGEPRDYFVCRCHSK